MVGLGGFFWFGDMKFRALQQVSHLLDQMMLGVSSKLEFSDFVVPVAGQHLQGNSWQTAVPWAGTLHVVTEMSMRRPRYGQLEPSNPCYTSRMEGGAEAGPEETGEGDQGKVL